MVFFHMCVEEVQGQQAAIGEDLGRNAIGDAFEPVLEYAMLILSGRFESITIGQVITHHAGLLSAGRGAGLAVGAEAEPCAGGTVWHFRDIVDEKSRTRKRRATARP